MRIVTSNILALVFLLSPALPAWAEAGGIEQEPARYVNVTIEIQGLEESVVLLKSAAASLADTMKALKNQDGKVDSQDLERIERVANSMDALVTKIDRTMSEAGDNIQQAREPVVGLVSDILQETRVEAIDPVIVSVRQTVAESVDQIKWGLIYVGLLLLFALSVFGFFMFKSLKQIRDITLTARNAFAQGEFTFRLKDEARFEPDAPDRVLSVDKPE